MSGLISAIESPMVAIPKAVHSSADKQFREALHLPYPIGFRTKLVWVILGFMLATLSCGGLSISIQTGAPADAPSTYTSQPPSTPRDALTDMPASTPSSLPAVPPASGVFTWAVIVDLNSEPVTREQAQALVSQASAILTELTGFSYAMTDFIESTKPGGVSVLMRDYMQSHTRNLPNGIIIFSYGEGDRARTYGGYSYSVNGPSRFRNTFISPVVGDNRVYISVQHWSHRFAQCGYGSTVAEVPVRDTSFNGECRNRVGIPCVEKHGYSMCSDAVDDLYASSPTYFAASTIIHETMHSFGKEGVMDHYGTEVCKARMAAGASDRPYDTLDLAQSAYYNGMCPDVYDNFMRAYQP